MRVIQSCFRYVEGLDVLFFFFSSRRRHTRWNCDWSSDVCSSDLTTPPYNPSFTTFSNLGPTNPALAKLVKQNADAILKLEGPYNPGLTIHQIPVDAVVPSGSGIDPEISVAYADLQARRVAAVRHLPLATVQSLIDQHTVGRQLGFFGEAGVNVLDLNLALDREQGS